MNNHVDVLIYNDIVRLTELRHRSGESSRDGREEDRDRCHSLTTLTRPVLLLLLLLVTGEIV